MKNNITFKKIVAILLTMLIVLSACSGKPASTGDEIFDTANSAVNAQLKLFEANGKYYSQFSQSEIRDAIVQVVQRYTDASYEEISRCIQFIDDVGASN